MRSIQPSAAPACCGAAGAALGVWWEPQLGGVTPYWDRGGGACETSVPVKLGSCSLALAAFSCFVPASLRCWSLPPCPSESRKRG